MAATASHESLTSLPLAEAKLQRQRKRIEQAEAALKAPAQLERDRQASRGKPKAWKAFDWTADASQLGQLDEGGVPVNTEVRVSTFRAQQSRASSLERSMSSLSQHTAHTGPPDMDRPDSASGFQLFTGRRTRKAFEQLGAYEDKPEEKQTTVEATFDKREIYNVFGNALPGQEFIEQNVGYKNGQIQFVQHPNGDVSAHQWSMQRYIWENIGQFSNIRKKAEGQLAADRLKGETAYQTLQQNTLVYFKTVAKQREANVMGVPFGAKEIQATIPDVKPAQAEPLPAAPKQPAADTDAESVFSEPERQPSTNDYFLQRTITHFQPPFQPSFQPEPESVPYYGGHRFAAGHPLHAPTAPRASRFGALFNSQAQAPRYDDPFYTQPANTYQSIYGGMPFHVQSYGAVPYGPAHDYYSLNVERPAARPTYNSFGQLEQPSRFAAWNVGAQEAFVPRRTNLETLRQQFPDPEPSAAGSKFSIGESTVVAPRPKPVTPLTSARTQMRDHLKRLGNQAEERRQSSDKGRTVLYDPFRDQQPAGSTSAAQVDAEVSSTDIRHTAPTPFNTAIFNETPAQYTLPTARVPAHPVESTPAARAVDENLKDSSPDTYWSKRATDISTPYMFSSSCEKPTPQNFRGPFFTADTPPPGSVTNSGNRSYDQKLKDWWTSGNSFMRQEEFYRSIKAVDNCSNSTLSSPPAALAPIGTPATSTSTSDSNTACDMTRLLIPVLENLASYVQGPVEKRRDYFSQWSQPPEWCIDRGPGGNQSFVDKEWGQPPQRVGRDMRYRALPVERVQFGGFGAASPMAVGAGVGVDRRFAFGLGMGM